MPEPVAEREIEAGRDQYQQHVGCRDHRAFERRERETECDVAQILENHGLDPADDHRRYQERQQGKHSHPEDAPDIAPEIGDGVADAGAGRIDGDGGKQQ